MKYLMVLQVRYIQCADGKISLEGAFWNHLLLMRDKLAEHGISLQVAMIAMNAEDLKGHISGWVEVRPADHNIDVICLIRHEKAVAVSKIRKLLSSVSVFNQIRKMVKDVDIVHTGLSYDVFLPTSFFSVVSAILMRKKLIFVVDIDFRNSARMLYKSGEWSFMSYMVNTLIYDLHKRMQIRVSTRYAHLSLLKGRKFAENYKNWGRNVQPFYNTVHRKEDIISSEQLNQILAARQETSKLNMVYFGRIVKYKGIQDAVSAIDLLVKQGFNNVHLTIIGNGNYKSELEQQVSSLGLNEYVSFKGSIPYGKELFDELTSHDVLIALPQREDTPRSAFDAMVIGLPIIAYDTYYYRELKDSNAVIDVPWKDSSALIDVIKHCIQSKTELIEKAVSATKFAEDNTQDDWMERRIDMTMQAVKGKC